MRSAGAKSDAHFHPELAGAGDVRVSPAIWHVRACGRFTALGGGHTAEATGSHYAVYGDKPDICLAETGYQLETHQTHTVFHSTLKTSEEEEAGPYRDVGA